MPMPKVLIVEDDEVIAQGMARHLGAAGFDAVWVGNGEQGLARLRYEQPDACVLDLMLPGLDGWKLIETVRAEGIATPVVVVSARGTEHDRVHALEIGADDYLVKPFSMKELVARVRAAARRGIRREETPRGEPIEIEELRIDPREVQAYVDGASAELTPTEFRLLYQLALEQGRVATRDELLQKLWGRRESHRDRTVDVFVRRLREKIDQQASAPHVHPDAVRRRLQARSRTQVVTARSPERIPRQVGPAARSLRCGSSSSPIGAPTRTRRSPPPPRRWASPRRCCPRATRSDSSSRETSRWGGSTSAKASTGSRAASLELERLTAAGVEVLNRPSTLVAAHDKLLTARALRLAGLPHPHTWLIAEGMPTPAPELPLVLKPRFGSWGRDVVLCRTRGGPRRGARARGLPRLVPGARRARAGARPAARLGSPRRRRRRAGRRRRAPRRRRRRMAHERLARRTRGAGRSAAGRADARARSRGGRSAATSSASTCCRRTAATSSPS